MLCWYCSFMVCRRILLARCGGAMGQLGCDWHWMCRKTCTVVRSTAVPLMLCHDTVEFIGSCCRFCIDWVISYCLRIDMKICKEFVNFPFLTKYEVSNIGSVGSNKCPVSCTYFASVEFECRYLKDWRCSLYLLQNDLPVCPMYCFPHSGYVSSLQWRLLLKYWVKSSAFARRPCLNKSLSKTRRLRAYSVTSVDGMQLFCNLQLIDCKYPVSLIISTYLCEKFCSLMKWHRRSHRVRLTVA